MTRPARARLAAAATLGALAAALNPLAAAAAESEAGGLDGRTLSPLWAVPFAGILLSIALGPSWRRASGTTTTARSPSPGARRPPSPSWPHAGPGLAFDTLLDTLLLEYLPFVILLLALFTVAGGIRRQGQPAAAPRPPTPRCSRPARSLASLEGTTGAAMLLIRPLIRANAGAAAARTPSSSSSSSSRTSAAR